MKTAFRLLAYGILCLSATGTAWSQSPVAGQPYQLPAGYEGYGYGTTINYGGYTYVSQGNGTMLLAGGGQSYGGGSGSAVAGQAYQLPAGYEGYGYGTLISYGGNNYVSQGNGTMLLAANQGASQPAQTYQPTQYQQPQYQQPQYQQPQYTYQQPQYNTYQPGMGSNTLGVYGGRTAGNANVAKQYDPATGGFRDVIINPGGGAGRNANPFGNVRIPGLRW